MRATALLLLAFASAPALAQAPSAASPEAPPTAGSESRDLWRAMGGFVRRVAADLPEEKYAYKPTKDVRTFGEMFAHVASAEVMFCAAALGEQPPAEGAAKTTTKAGMLEVFRAAQALCERAYAQSDAALSAPAQVLGQARTRRYALMINAVHDAEHYGNVVTYLRMNGMVPPSSQPQRVTP